MVASWYRSVVPLAQFQRLVGLVSSFSPLSPMGMVSVFFLGTPDPPSPRDGDQAQSFFSPPSFLLVVTTLFPC